MLQHSSSNALGDHILQIPLSDRWRIYHRLQELMVPCSCHPDGSLRVQVNSCLTVILVHSTVKQFVASRQELIDWLEQCWQL
ncbi:Asr1405/Asl0597 family protein [Chlorogloeopsis sp. ULAP02]|uniref:Asr1405/Asl0597 family protein n=1 Tax=Chlorogloeopsis sp. ULAP02 TaxID=3107926 RepID=UPI003135BA7A